MVYPLHLHHGVVGLSHSSVSLDDTQNHFSPFITSDSVIFTHIFQLLNLNRWMFSALLELIFLRIEANRYTYLGHVFVCNAAIKEGSKILPYRNLLTSPPYIVCIRYIQEPVKCSFKHVIYRKLEMDCFDSSICRSNIPYWTREAVELFIPIDYVVPYTNIILRRFSEQPKC